MLSFTLLVLCPLLVQCAPHLNVQFATRDDPQVQLSVTNPSHPSKSVPFRIRPAEPPDPPQNITSLAPCPLIMAYYPDWVDDSFQPEDIPCNRFDWVDFAFALPTNKTDLTWDNPDSAPDKLRRLVSHCHSCGTKAKLSIGGWTGSKYFSSAVRTPETRARFVNSIRDVYDQYKLDGIDIDWEYPGREGADGNQIASDDYNNLLLFLQTLRSVLPVGSCLTAAVPNDPFQDDLTPFAVVLNWTMLMNYDVFGSSSVPGPNAPLSNGCGNSTQPKSNAAAGVLEYSNAGIPASQLVLGLPSYGYLSLSSAQRLRQRRRTQPKYFRRDSSGSSVKLVGEDNAEQGQIMFRQLVKQGALKRVPTADNSTAFLGAGGFTRFWDKCSSTPFLRSDSTQQIVAYDDPESFELKAKFVSILGLLGVNMFDVHGDTEQEDLTEAMMKGLTFKCRKQ